MGADKRKKIRNAIAELGKAGAYEVYEGKVLSVDENATTITVEVLELTFYDVRLRSVITDDTGVWVLPKVGSFVTIGQIEGGVEYVLIRPSEIDKVFIKIGTKTMVIQESKLLATYGDTTIELNNDFAKIQSGSKKINISNTAIVHNNGSNDGLVKVNAILTKVNNIENKVNAILTMLGTWVPVANDGGAALKALYTASSLTTLSALIATIKADIENPDVTH